MNVVFHPTCLVDFLAPGVAQRALHLLQRLGVDVVVPQHSSCCGQPAYNAGYWEEARRVAAAFVAELTRALERGARFVVLPSGSCAGMVVHGYPSLFADAEPRVRARAGALRPRVREMSQFLVHVLGVEDVGASFPAKATYHPSCHAIRLLGLTDEPLRLLRRVRGLVLVDLPYAEDCCGFGGTFSVAVPSVSLAMADEKIRHVAATGADLLVTGDLGCLLHLRGRLEWLGMSLPVLHWLEVLGGGNPR